MENGWKSEKSKKISYVVFAVYLLLLCWLVLFKFATNIEEIPHLRQLNLIPFHYETMTSLKIHAEEVVYNVLVFIPAGVYFTAFDSKRKCWRGILFTFLVSLSFETIQWIFSIGVSDITDLIGNTFGGALGAGLFYLLGKMIPNNRMCVINGIGILVELMAFALLMILLR